MKTLIFLSAAYAILASNCPAWSQCSKSDGDTLPELTSPMRSFPYDFEAHSIIFSDKKYSHSCVFIQNNSTSQVWIDWRGVGLRSWFPSGRSKPFENDFVQKLPNTEEINYKTSSGCLLYGNKPFKSSAKYYHFLQEQNLTNSPNYNPEDCRISSDINENNRTIKISADFYYEFESEVFVRLNPLDPNSLVQIDAKITLVNDRQQSRLLTQVEINADHYENLDVGDVADLRISMDSDFAILPNIEANHIDKRNNKAPEKLAYSFALYMHSEPQPSGYMADNKPSSPADGQGNATYIEQTYPSYVKWFSERKPDPAIYAKIKHTKAVIMDDSGHSLGEINVPYLSGN